MHFFNKSQRVVQPVNSFFRKTSGQANRFFSKGGMAESGLRQASNSFRKTGNTLNQISTQADKVLNSDIAAALAGRAGGNGLAAYQGLKGTSQAIRLAGNMTNQVSAATNRNNYSGSSGNVINNALERSTKVCDTGRSGHDIRFE
jgi:hypothetical protein